MPTADSNGAPHLSALHPPAAMPGGEVVITGRHLGPDSDQRPRVRVGDTPALLAFSRPDRLIARVAEGSVSGGLTVLAAGRLSNPLHIDVAVPLTENVNPVANPAVDADGNIYVGFSGPRGESVSTSIFRVDTNDEVRPFLSGILNATGLAFDSKGVLYVSSRQEGTVYRVTPPTAPANINPGRREQLREPSREQAREQAKDIPPPGTMSVYAEGMGVATGIAFDRKDNLYVGDRSGTIFKIAPDRQIFVFATLEPSIAAYHLAFAPHGSKGDGTLYVTGPTTSSYDSVYAIDDEGNSRTFFTGLGRPQGLALDAQGNIFVAASLHGRRGVVRITPAAEASLAVAGSGIVGLAFLPGGGVALATGTALYRLGEKAAAAKPRAALPRG